MLLLFGLVVGRAGFDIVPAILTSNFDLIADMALLMIGFLLGEHLTPRRLRQAGRTVAAIVLGKTLGVTLLVGGALAAIGVPLLVAVPLACIATASAPAATLDVVQEVGARGRFSETLIAIVALDDVVGLLLFSFGLAAAMVAVGYDGAGGALWLAAHDIGGALMLGVALGVPGAVLSGRIQEGQPLLVEALGLVFLCGGLALVFEVSFLIASMTMGAAIANLARHHERPFHAIEGIERPFMIVFFAVAGAVLELDSLRYLGAVAVVYALARALGLIAGSALGARLAGAPVVVARYMGMALLAQAGVAMGMALVAAARLPEYRQLLLSVVIGTTIVFELVGPPCTRLALRAAERSPQARSC